MRRASLAGWAATLVLGASCAVFVRADDPADPPPPSDPVTIDVHMHLDGKVAAGGAGKSDGSDSDAPKGPGAGGDRRPPGGGGQRPGPGGQRPGPGGQRPEPGGPEKNYEAAADRLVELMDRLGVKKCLVMPPPQSPNQKGGYTYKELLGAIRSHKGRLVLAAGGGELSPLLAGTDPSAVTDALRADFEKKVREMIADGARAFGEMAALHFSFSEHHVHIQIDPDHPLFLLLADLAAKHNMAVDLHMDVVPEDQPLPKGLEGRSPNNPKTIRANLARFERLLAHNRRARIVWQHIGWDNTGHMTPDLLRRLLKAHANLFGALKVVDSHYEKFRAGNDLVGRDGKVDPEWLKVFEEFPDRFVMGADEFIGASGQSGPKGPPSFEATWALLKQLPADLRRRIGGENAARIYALE